MSYLILFLISTVFNACVLAVLPYVRYKNFISCLSTAALAALIHIPLAIFGGIIGKVAAIILWFVPFLGPAIINPLVQILLTWTVSAASLFIADQMIEDLEIPSITETFKAAFMLGVASFLASQLLNLFF